MPNFDIIITNWNRLEYLKKTVASLIQSGAWADAERVIIVDNGSTEGGVHAFLEDLRRVHGVFLVLLPHNRGWGKAVNEAIGLSRSEFLLLSNNDVDYNTIDFHKTMLQIMQVKEGDRAIGILGVWRHTGHHIVEGGVHDEKFDEMDNVPAVGWMLNKRAMQKVGMLPEKGAHPERGGNGEDSDYVMRMKEAGYLVGVPKNDIAVHIDGY